MNRITLLLLLFVCGCASSYNLTARVTEIEQKHNVVIKTDDSLDQGCLSELLGVIEKDLERCPQYFKDNIGPIFIENSFSEIGSKGMFLAGYVDTADMWNRYPIHMKNRSMLEKVLFFMPREDEVFLHEASHSFELNIKAEISNKWDGFYEQFSGVQTRQYDEGALLCRAFLPVYSRPASMPSLYGSANHFEDFAETHCYLRRNNIELIKDKDPVLYEKCKIVERFTNTDSIANKSELFSSQAQDKY